MQEDPAVRSMKEKTNQIDSPLLILQDEEKLFILTKFLALPNNYSYEVQYLNNKK